MAGKRPTKPKTEAGAKPAAKKAAGAAAPAERPHRGGSYVRDRATGALTRKAFTTPLAQAAPEAATAPAETAPPAAETDGVKER